MNLWRGELVVLLGVSFAVGSCGAAAATHRNRLTSQLSQPLCPPASPPAKRDRSEVVVISDRYQPPADAVLACVAQQPIAGATFSHWLRIATKSNTLRAPNNRLELAVMDFLIRARWYIDEAKADHVALSDAEIRRAFERDKRAQYPTATARRFRNFLRSTGETVADILYRTTLNLLFQELQARFHIKGTASTVAGRVDHRLAVTWKPRTYCRRAYIVRGDCGHQF